MSIIDPFPADVKEGAFNPINRAWWWCENASRYHNVYDIETLSTLLAHYVGIRRSPVDSSTKKSAMRSIDAFLLLA